MDFVLIIMSPLFSSQEQEFSISVINGKIVVTANAGEGALVLPSDLDTYNDGKWHYLSVVKSGRK